MMRTRILGLALTLALALLVWGLAGASAAAQPAPGAGHGGGPQPPQAVPPAVPAVCGQMNTVPSPNVGGGWNYLSSVSALANGDVWAVGLFKNGAIDQTLVEHWNGSTWSVVPSPNVGSAGNRLARVSALASNDVWAVGSVTIGLYDQTLVEHWNGSVWSVVASPNVGNQSSYLTAVAARASDDVWAVGYYYTYVNGNVFRALAEHWDGTSWSVVPTPDVAGSSEDVLSGVTALTSFDVWAVGRHYDDSTHLQQTLVEHWDGGAWSIVLSPNLGSSDNYLFAVSAQASNDVWAVGNYLYNSSYFQTLVEHWNGSVWSVVPSPNLGSGSNYLYGVAARASNDVWAVGFVYANGSPALVQHWDGSTWSVVPAPSPGSGINTLYGVSALPGGDVVTVGEYYNGSSAPQTLVTEYGGPCGCTINFSDVQPANYFYTPVLYLVCHGVISGYADGTFRPYANTTRSQMVKIVVLGFNKAITLPGGTAYSFSDVPRSHPFFAVVETAYAGGIVSGYTCGAAPAGPCDAQHRPYFLPYANVTRGQLSKIDVLAAGWPFYTPSAATFTDVAPSSPFYAAVETAVCHGGISGYADHTFRPFANGTRAQIAKIVYQSIVSPPVTCGP